LTAFAAFARLAAFAAFASLATFATGASVRKEAVYFTHVRRIRVGLRGFFGSTANKENRQQDDPTSVHDFVSSEIISGQSLISVTSAIPTPTSDPGVSRLSRARERYHKTAFNDLESTD
jgi:hypothetical protein